MNHNRNLQKALGRRVPLLLAMAALPLALTGPAQADSETGQGTGSGSETNFVTNPVNPPPGPPLCLEVTASTYEVVADGTVTAGDGTVVYTGSDITITMVTDHSQPVIGNYFISPQGTYGAATVGGACDPATLGPLGDIPIDVTISAGNTTSGVGAAAGGTCAGSGQYNRVNTNITVTWSASCFVKSGAASGTDTSTEFVLEGNLLPTGDINPAAYVQDVAP